MSVPNKKCLNTKTQVQPKHVESCCKGGPRYYVGTWLSGCLPIGGSLPIVAAALIASIG